MYKIHVFCCTAKCKHKKQDRAGQDQCEPRGLGLAMKPYWGIIKIAVPPVPQKHNCACFGVFGILDHLLHNRHIRHVILQEVFNS